MGCERTVAVTPEAISNRPSLGRIRYRVGSYATFRRSMLEAISRCRGTPGDPDARPLAAWTTRSDDFGIAFLEMWAYLGDILTFYQERIANEAFLRTGAQPESTAYLVSLIGYRPAPGRAAGVEIAFTAEPDATVLLRERLLVQSVPGQDEKPQKFETIEDVEALASLNVLRPRTMQPQTLARGSVRVVLDGTGLGVAEGDWIAIVGDERRTTPGSEIWDLRRVASVEEDEESETTTLGWQEGLGATARPWRGPIDPSANPEIWVFRGQAWPFGYNAPDFNLLDPSVAARLVGENGSWNDAYLPEDGAHPDHIYLDAVYPDVVPGGWIALITSRIDTERHPQLAGYPQYVELYPILESVDTTRLNYTLSGKVTRVTVDLMSSSPDEGFPEHIRFFPIRGTVALVQSERLPMADVPIGHSSLGRAFDRPVAVAGDRIELDGHFPALARGRRLLVTGVRLDASDAPLGEGVEAVEVSSVAHEPAPGGGSLQTVVTLLAPLADRYRRDSLVIYGNVTRATHGETVADEALGDGDAAAEFQTFTLGKTPLTYVARAGAPGGVAPALDLRVDGVGWEESAELHGRAGDARAFMLRQDPDGTTNLHFGDGSSGSRLVSGRLNVRATYRVGLGPEANVRGGSLRTLLKKPLGLKAATNPAAAAGGTAPEDPASVKVNAPGTVRTFGRIVSLRDFEDSAREYIGIAKASAAWRWDGEVRVVDLVVAGVDGASVEPIRADLRADLDARRDPHQPLAIRDYTPLPVSVAVHVIVDDAYLLESVQAGADAALKSLFAFDRLELGQSVHLSDVHGALGAVDGVVAVDVETFRFKEARHRVDRGGDAPVQPRLLVGPGELPWVEDPDDARVTEARFLEEELA